MERAIHRSPPRAQSSTVCRELASNSTPGDGYALQSAQAACQSRRKAALALPLGGTRTVVSGIPSAIFCSGAGRPSRLPAHCKACILMTHARACPTRPSTTPSTPISRGELNKQLLALLRQGRSGCRPRSAGQDRRWQIPDMVSIHVRPSEANNRSAVRVYFCNPHSLWQRGSCENTNLRRLLKHSPNPPPPQATTAET